MASNSSLKKKHQLPRYKKNNSYFVKNTTNKNMTHSEFISFVEPFYELVKEKNLEELKKQNVPKIFNLKKDLYVKLNEQLREKLCCSFIFNEDMEINSSVEYNTKLTLRKPIKTSNIFYNIFEKHDILKNYESTGYKNLIAEYENQVKINNERKLIVYDLVKERMKYQCYTHAFDLVHYELDELAKRNKLKKTQTCGTVDLLIVKEYLERLEEFYDLFGTFDQFDDNQLNYKDSFESDKGHNFYFN